MPSLSERIALHQSTASSPTVDSAVDIPTYLPLHSPITHLVDGMVRCSRQGCGRMYSDPIHPPTYRAPWRDNLRARDETGL